ncbi:MAG: hypothetical protein K0U84_00650 [Actinomycetia bacterium]|nr:hypothetical protein [Actinomycetes bacterium]
MLRWSGWEKSGRWAAGSDSSRRPLELAQHLDGLGYYNVNICTADGQQIAGIDQVRGPWADPGVGNRAEREPTNLPKRLHPDVAGDIKRLRAAKLAEARSQLFSGDSAASRPATGTAAGEAARAEAQRRAEQRQRRNRERGGCESGGRG